MTAVRTISDIRARFESERDYIQRFMAFLADKVTLREQDVSEVARVLDRYGLPGIPTRSDWRRYHEPYSFEEAERVALAVRQTYAALDEAIAAADQHLDSLQVPDGLGEIDARSTMGEWIQFFLDAFENSQDEKAIEKARTDALAQQAEAIREYGDDAWVLEEPDVDRAIEGALFLLADRKASRLHRVREQFAEIELAARIAAPHAELNVLRQGFLLLMTAFDAAVFDLVRSALQLDFFARVTIFESRRRISIEQLSAV